MLYWKIASRPPSAKFVFAIAKTYLDVLYNGEIFLIQDHVVSAFEALGERRFCGDIVRCSTVSILADFGLYGTPALTR